MKKSPASRLDLAQAALPLQAAIFQQLDQLDSARLAPAPMTQAATPPAVSAVISAKRRKVLLRRETKQRGGKTVVIVYGFPLAEKNKLEPLARDLRKRLGCGGTVERGEIVLQGDRPAAVSEALRALGYEPGGVTS